MSLDEAIRPAIIRDTASGLPLITSVGEVQERVLVEKGQAVVQQALHDVAVRDDLILRLKSVIALLLTETTDEIFEFDLDEFDKIVGRGIQQEVIDTPDGRKLWRFWLSGEKADAARQRDAHGMRVLKGGTA